jgi:CheY-like chemotaxis protein
VSAHFDRKRRQGMSMAAPSPRNDKTGPTSILVVDDEPTLIALVRQVLEGSGYAVFSTTNPLDAGRILEQQKIDLVTLDLMMPQKDGFEVYKELEAARDIPVLFVTGYPQRFTTDSDTVLSLWQREFARGRTDILYKPFDVRTLLEKVEGLVGPARQA